MRKKTEKPEKQRREREREREARLSCGVPAERARRSRRDVAVSSRCLERVPREVAAGRIRFRETWNFLWHFFFFCVHASLCLKATFVCLY